MLKGIVFFVCGVPGRAHLNNDNSCRCSYYDCFSGIMISACGEELKVPRPPRRARRVKTLFLCYGILSFGFLYHVMNYMTVFVLRIKHDDLCIGNDPDIMPGWLIVFHACNRRQFSGV